VRSNTGASSSSTIFIAVVLNTFSSFGETTRSSSLCRPVQNKAAPLFPVGEMKTARASLLISFPGGINYV
jgi:hypothetical protein